MGLWVVSSVGRALKGKDQVVGVDDRDVLVVVECAVESIGKEVGEDKVVPFEEGGEERGVEGRQGVRRKEGRREYKRGRGRKGG